MSEIYNEYQDLPLRERYVEVLRTHLKQGSKAKMSLHISLDASVEKENPDTGSGKDS